MIDTPNREYNIYKEDYEDLDDFFAGERRVKDKGTRYTPCIEGHRGKPTAYQTYKEFGILYNALQRTRQGLVGAMLRKPVDIQAPKIIENILPEIMIDGGSFNDLVRETCRNVIGFGRFGILSDIDDNEQPYCATYSAPTIIDWPRQRKRYTKQKIRLIEAIEKPKPDDESETDIITQIRQLEIDDKGKYLVTIHQKIGDDWQTVEVREPKYKGSRLDYIPFTFFGSSSNIPTPSRPPLLDLLYLCKGHWKLTVAYQYGLNFAGLPTPVICGDFGIDGQLPLGPGAALIASDPASNATFLMTGGQGLAEMERGLDRLERQMAIVGARMLEEQRPGVEAAETVRLRSSGDSATLSDIALNVGNGLTQVVRHLGAWYGIKPTEINIGVNTDFIDTSLSPQDIQALLQAVQSGQISQETFLWNLKQGEILQPGRTIEDETEAIADDKERNKRDNPGLAGLAGSFLNKEQ